MGGIREGKGASPEPLPFTLGSDLAGDVVAISPDTSGMTVGSQVFGVTNSQFLGAYAEYAVASAGMLAMKPKSLTYVKQHLCPWSRDRLAGSVCRSIPRSWPDGASFMGLRETAERTRFSSLVGLTSVPSRRQGAEEHGVRARSLGADRVVDFRAERFEDDIRNADAVLDLVGGEIQGTLLSGAPPGRQN